MPASDRAAAAPQPSPPPVPKPLRLDALPPAFCAVNPQLPLAVYREVAAHLQVVPGVRVGLRPQTATTFDYLRSQVGALWVKLPEAPLRTAASARAAEILAFYGDRYGQWLAGPSVDWDAEEPDDSAR